MAQIGLKHFVAAKRGSDGSYTEGRVLGTAVKASTSIDKDVQKNYGDDGVVDSLETVTGGKLNISANYISDTDEAWLLGASIDGNGQVVSNVEDEAIDVGIGYCRKVRKTVSGVKSTVYQGRWFKKARFGVPSEEDETKGQSVSFKNPEIEAEIYADDSGDWREKQEFTTEAAAVAWLENKAGITTRVSTPVPSVTGGIYTGTQSVTLACATSGATIKYTTDGSTPATDNGTTYSTAISIASTTVLKFFAYKASLENSEQVVETYIIN
jgi:phi13 family phage major tail protein